VGRINKKHLFILVILSIIFSDVAFSFETVSSSRGIGVNKTFIESKNGLYANLHALVIGIDKYNDVKIPTLQYAINDSTAIANELINLGFMSENIIRLEGDDATKANILSLIKNRLRTKISNDDGLIVFFAGHGMYAKTKSHSGEVIERGYLLPVDARSDRIDSTGISMHTFSSILNTLPAKHVLLAIDACYSGFAFKRSASTEGFVDKLTSKRSRYVITAGGRNEQAIEAAGHGLFTERLLEGLDGLADLDIDGYVTSSELGAYLRSSVSKLSNNKQTPIFGSIEGEGEFVFNVANNRPGYRKALRKNLVSQHLYGQAYKKGLELFKKGDLKKAKLLFQEAVSHRPRDYWAMQKIKYINAYQPYKSTITFPDGNAMLLIKGDSFIMGASTQGFENEKPRRTTFVDDYYMSKYEITIQNYIKFLNNNRSVSLPIYFDLQKTKGNSQLPIEGVSWDDANKYCKYFGGQLPTEKQWEFAGRGGDGRAFISGAKHVDGEITNWFYDKSYKTAAPVGSFESDQSVFGIFDLEGNVREWVADIDSGYLMQEVPIDLTGKRFKVVRGAGYKTKSVNKLRLTVRGFRHPDTKYTGIGFRCAKKPAHDDYD
jgi:formylglycine-generating enzyme required for sulfatase activity